MNVTELLSFAYGTVYAADLKAGDVILRDAIGGQVHVQVGDVYRVTGGSRKGGLAVHYEHGDGRTGYFHPADTDLVLRAYYRPAPSTQETNR